MRSSAIHLSVHLTEILYPSIFKIAKGPQLDKHGFSGCPPHWSIRESNNKIILKIIHLNFESNLPWGNGLISLHVARNNMWRTMVECYWYANPTLNSKETCEFWISTYFSSNQLPCIGAWRLCVSTKSVNIDSDDVLSRQAITWANADILSIRPLKTNFIVPKNII